MHDHSAQAALTLKTLLYMCEGAWERSACCQKFKPGKRVCRHLLSDAEADAVEGARIFWFVDGWNKCKLSDMRMLTESMTVELCMIVVLALPQCCAEASKNLRHNPLAHDILEDT